MSKEQLHCHYSDLPSPIAYMRVTGDSIEKKSFTMKRFIEKMLLWWSFKKPQRNKKSIWKL